MISSNVLGEVFTLPAVVSREVCKKGWVATGEAVSHRTGPFLGVAHLQGRKEPNTMADDMRIAFEAIARKLAGMHDGDILREGVRMLAHALMEAEVETHVGAAPHERTTTRTGPKGYATLLIRGSPMPI